LSRFLSEEWFSASRRVAGDATIADGVSGRVVCEVSGGPDGEVRCGAELADGRLETWAPGVIDDPDLVLTTTAADAAAIQRGELDPSVAYMQGRLKAAGSMSLLLALLSATASEAHRELRRRVEAVTEF
jgi:SCP-2 sterol transfer family